MNLSRALQALSFRGMARRFERAEPALPFDLIAPGDGGLVIPADPEHLKRRPAEDITWKDVAISSALHALLLLLFLGVIDNLLREQDQVVPPPPPISVSIVQEQPPPPPPPPPQQQQKQEPQPPQPKDDDPRLRSSDASSEGPSPPKPAAKGEAAPSQPEQGKLSLAPSKKETSPALHDPTPPKPDAFRKTTEAQRKDPKPTRAKDDEVAAFEAPQTTVQTRRSETRESSTSGKDKATGFEVVGDDNPGGPEAAIYDAYLAKVRDQIVTAKSEIRNYWTAGAGFQVAITLDAQGRLMDMEEINNMGSRPLSNAARNMITRASLAGFPPPPAMLLRDGTLKCRFVYFFPPDRSVFEQAIAGK
jgi:hypothetical protein